MSVTLSIIIVSYNIRELLRECLYSVYEEVKDLAVEVIVVDNASSDESVEMISQEFPQVSLRQEIDNLGFAGGNNVGIQSSTGKYVLLLNPDTVVCKNSIRTMVLYLETHPLVGAVGCRLTHPITGDEESSGRSFPTALGLFFTISYLDRIFPKSKLVGTYRMTYWRRNESQEVDWVSGACIMVRRAAINSAGLLDKRYFMYAEDVDWCYRIKQAGWQIWFLSDALVGHYGGQSAKSWPEAVQKSIKTSSILQHYDSLLKFARFNYSESVEARFRWAISAGLVVRWIIWLGIEAFSILHPVEKRSSVYIHAIKYLLLSWRYFNGSSLQ